MADQISNSVEVRTVIKTRRDKNRPETETPSRQSLQRSADVALMDTPWFPLATYLLYYTILYYTRTHTTKNLSLGNIDNS